MWVWKWVGILCSYHKHFTKPHPSASAWTLPALFHVLWFVKSFIWRDLPAHTRTDSLHHSGKHRKTARWDQHFRDKYRKQRKTCRKGLEGKLVSKPQIWRRMGQEVGGWLQRKRKAAAAKGRSSRVWKSSAAGSGKVECQWVKEKRVEDGAMSRKDKACDWKQEIAQSHRQGEASKNPVSSAPQLCWHSHSHSFQHNT